jgi:hypothetical protein
MVPNICIYQLYICIPYTLGLPSSKLRFWQKIAPILETHLPTSRPTPCTWQDLSLGLCRPMRQTAASSDNKAKCLKSLATWPRGGKITTKKDGKKCEFYIVLCHDVGVYGYQMVSKPILIGLRYGIWWGVHGFRQEMIMKIESFWSNHPNWAVFNTQNVVAFYWILITPMHLKGRFLSPKKSATELSIRL